MALKPDRYTLTWELSYYLNATGVQGMVVDLNAAASGADMDSDSNEVTISATPSGKNPVGILMDDFVNRDLTKFPLNWHKPESQIGSKASILRKGWVVTDQTFGTPTAGSHAVMYGSGLVMNAPTAWNVTHVNFPRVGKFLTNEDADGFVKLFVDL